jgi:hypothetical protein
MNFCSLSIAATYAFAQQPIENIAECELPSLLAVYKDIHSHPGYRRMKNERRQSLPRNYVPLVARSRTTSASMISQISNVTALSV